MDVFKFGFKQWKRHLPLDILTKLLSFIALTADLLLPMLTAIFINHIIQEQAVDHKNFFSFLLTGEYGEMHT
ncbi:MAG: ABC transporter ATP-binding protein, partial [Lachnospiraceae bacterium]|nr:ABC transporter ATP-binding protein [Lachnospiraceae bacterium]